LAGALLAAAPPAAAARSHAVIAGSSTMYPFAVAVTERWGGPGALVLPMGSGAGIAWFCEGLGPATPDFALASRAMTPEEASACRVAGVRSLEPALLGWDGIVLAGRAAGELKELGLADLWRALAARVPDPAGSGEWIPNPYRRWSDLRAGLPDRPIRVLGPPATSGTRDAFVALAMQPACRAALELHPLPVAERRHCGELRRDGAWLDAGENDDWLVGRLRSDRGALGVVGFGALVRNPGLIGAVCLEGACPTQDAIRAGAYPLARPLYLYWKAAHREFVPRLEGLVLAFSDPAASGAEGYLAALGLVAAQRAAEPPAAGAPLEKSEIEAATTDHGARARWLAAALLAVLVGTGLGMGLMRRAAPARRKLERAVVFVLWSSAAVCGALLALLLATLVVPAARFFLQVSPLEFLSGTHWSPESAIRVSQVVGEGAFGVLPVVLGSAMVAAIALGLAFPLAFGGALYSFAWASRRHRRAWSLGTRVAAVIPAVVYGLLAALTVGPAVVALAGRLGLPASADNTLAAGIVVGIMLLPVLAVRLEEAFGAVPARATAAALGLGATRWESLRDIILPAAAPAIGAAVLLAVSRALGETIIVLMAAGLVASWNVDPLAATTTLTAQMVALMSGTHDIANVRTQLPFVLGLFLAMIVLPLNAWAMRILRRSDVIPSPVF
jgi:ABC-type phosphate transport system permease subunit/ABC-type phosphate transport system substrate-binding protein